MAKKKKPQQSGDSAYVLKLILFMILGTLWIRLYNPDGSAIVPIPVGLVVGFFFAGHEHFQIDRKIEYAILLVAMFVSYWLPFSLIEIVL